MKKYLILIVFYNKKTKPKVFINSKIKNELKYIKNIPPDIDKINTRKPIHIFKDDPQKSNLKNYSFLSSM